MKRTIDRVRAEFEEMPGLRLTVPQIERLLGVEPSMCQPVLDSLVERGFLQVNADGTYSRLTSGATIRALNHRAGAPRVRRKAG